LKYLLVLERGLELFSGLGQGGEFSGPNRGLWGIFYFILFLFLPLGVGFQKSDFPTGIFLKNFPRIAMVVLERGLESFFLG
jgi:hypothetical protein